MKQNFDIKNKVLIAYTGNDAIVRVPHGVRIIGQEAFRDCPFLTEVKLPRSVTTICERAFLGCTNLKDVKLPAKLSVIREDVFADCKALETLTFPKHLSSLSSAFRGCGALSLLVFKSKHTIYLGKGVFDGVGPSLCIHFGGSTSLWESMTEPRNATGAHITMGEFERGREFPLYHAAYGENFTLTVYCGKAKKPLKQNGSASGFAEWQPYF